MKKILLVDDEAEQLEILKTSLECKELKAEIVTASSGEEALEIIKKDAVNLLITDVHMPGMNGMELVLAATEAAPALSVIVITAFPTAEIKRDAMMRGCLRFMEKPYDVEELRATVLEAIAEQKGFSGTMSGIDLTDMIQLNCLSCNTAALKVSHGKKSGMIFFEGGDIVHAMTGKLEGAEAFFTIMSFAGGNIESRKNVRAPARTIEASHVALLLEASRRQDEDSGDDASGNAPFRELAKITGYLGAEIINEKGQVVAVDTDDDKIDLNTGGAILADLFKLAGKIVAKSGLEACQATIIEAEGGTVISCKAGKKEHLLLVSLLAPGSNATLMRMKMDQLAPGITA